MSELVKKLESALEQVRTLENHSAEDRAGFNNMSRNLRIMSRNLHTVRTELTELQGTLDRERASHDIVWADRCAAHQKVEDLTSEVKRLKAHNTKLDEECERLAARNTALDEECERLETLEAAVGDTKARIAELEASNEVLTHSCQANAYSEEYVRALEAAACYVPQGSQLYQRIASERQKMQETRKNLNHKG